MIKKIVKTSLNFPVITIIIAGLMIFYGLYTLPQAKYGLFPEFAPPMAVIQTEAPGLSANQVEVLVTHVIETSINGTPGIKRMISKSIQGLSVITVTFKSNSDIYLDRQLIYERLSNVSNILPKGMKAPVLTPLTSATGLIMDIGLTSKKISIMKLYTLANFAIKPQLLAVSGVSNVVVFGKKVKSYQIQIKPEKLEKYGLSIGDVIRAAKKATGIRGAGFISTPNQRIVLQSAGEPLNAKALSQVVIRHENGMNLTIQDVATVVAAPLPPIGAAMIGGKAGVELVVSAQYGANILKVTKHVETALAGLKPYLKKQGISVTKIFRPADYIKTALANLSSALKIGVILIIIILLLFLFNWRTAFISLLAIPISLVIGITVMSYFGISLNVMTLGGFAVAIGLLVDDAVITVQNIYERLRQNNLLESPKPLKRVILDAIYEVRSSVVYATLAIVIVFMPVLTISGVGGRFFGPLGIAFILAILGSLIVALTVTPALSVLLLKKKSLPKSEPSHIRLMKNIYAALLHKVQRHGKIVIAAAIIVVLIGLSLIPLLKSEFLPQMSEGHFNIHMHLATGTSLNESMKTGKKITKDLMKLPFVKLVAQRTGRAYESEDTPGPYYSEIDVSLKPGINNKLAEQAISKIMKQFAGVNFEIDTYLSDRIDETISGFPGNVAVNVFGNSPSAINRSAQKVYTILQKIHGATGIQMQSPPGLPQLIIRLKPEALRSFGFEPVQVLDAVQTAYHGSVVGQVYHGNNIFNVVAILNPKDRNNVEKIGLLPLKNSTGTFMPLKELARIYMTNGRYVILNNGARMVQTITLNVKNRSAGNFIKEAKNKIKNTHLSSGTYVEFTGTAKEQSKAVNSLMIHSIIAAIAVLLLLSIVLGTFKNSLLILINLPFALVGSVLIVFAAGGVVSLGSMIGFITVFGITLRNSMLMLSHYDDLLRIEKMPWNIETAIKGAVDRLIPILMTALITGMGLLPLAISNAPGQEIDSPMAIVILGGLATSTILNLLVLPNIALRYGKFKTATDFYDE